MVLNIPQAVSIYFQSLKIFFLIVYKLFTTIIINTYSSLEMFLCLSSRTTQLIRSVAMDYGYFPSITQKLEVVVILRNMNLHISTHLSVGITCEQPNVLNVVLSGKRQTVRNHFYSSYRNDGKKKRMMLV